MRLDPLLGWPLCLLPPLGLVLTSLLVRAALCRPVETPERPIRSSQDLGIFRR